MWELKLSPSTSNFCCHCQITTTIGSSMLSEVWGFVEIFTVFVQLCSQSICVKFHIWLLCAWYIIVDESDSDADVPRGKVLAAALHLVPGYFSCDCMWQTHFVLHPRLKSTGTSAPRSTISPGQHLHIFTVYVNRFFLLKNLIGFWSLIMLEQLAAQCTSVLHVI